MLGVSRATVYNWFNGETRPTRELSDKIEQMLPSIEAGYTQEV
jgi:predicted transcriptional regulator